MLILWGKNQDDLAILCVCTETLSNVDLRDSGLIRFYTDPSGDVLCWVWGINRSEFHPSTR